VRRGPLVVVGDTLLDRDLAGRADRVSPDAPVPVLTDLAETARPGGAGLAALLAAADGRDVVLVTALAADPAGERLRRLLAGAGVTVLAGRLAGRTPEKVRIRAGGQSLLRLDWADDEPPGIDPPAELAGALRRAGAVLASDYGRGLLAADPVRAAVAGVTRQVPVVWDPHPRGGSPVPGVLVATPNLAEALAATGSPGRGTDASVVRAAARAGRQLLGRWRARGVAVTLGSHGALLATEAQVPLLAPARSIAAGDTCGAGDRFAATVAGALGAGALPGEAVTAGVAAATGYVAAGGPASLGAAPGRSPAIAAAPDARAEVSTVDDVVRAVRARGGTVVATGGCFDLLHAGHVRTLEAARQLGDCLVVCVNSDASVRRLKGPRRPAVPDRDRVRVLAALGCVDAVTVFDEDTPLGVLDRIRPDIWVKGGDYTAAELPETALLAGWGAEVVIVPYLEGRSSSGLLHAVAGDDIAG
jgi:rfaE bifunctional protein nucleotidyltransferase chain/domain/rfaE bifunctional protein kinase chain/domain